ncbi:hypothetical protein VNO77_18019 [Canavalia gladiata]|uniref:Uncharacterized protein n=1 Tax=Canavalia gladiata TaxID=3824 RepID=A0AAN9QN92_CANGL
MTLGGNNINFYPKPYLTGANMLIGPIGFSIILAGVPFHISSYFIGGGAYHQICGYICARKGCPGISSKPCRGKQWRTKCESLRCLLFSIALYQDKVKGQASYCGCYYHCIRLRVWHMNSKAELAKRSRAKTENHTMIMASFFEEEDVDG